MLTIGGFQKSSLIDYPEKISAVIFTQGCNFRCPYCHNPELINIEYSHIHPPLLRGRVGVGETLEFLKTRIGKLDGVVITGGEPTLHKDLPAFIKEIKQLGFAIKLDTNGTNSTMLAQLINEKLVDYVAMDIKAPIEKYSEVTCSKVNTTNIIQSIDILKNANIDYEFRTTVVKSQLSRADFFKIGALISNSQKYYLQRFVPTKTIDENFLKEETYTDNEFTGIINSLQKNIADVKLR